MNVLVTTRTKTRNGKRDPSFLHMEIFPRIQRSQTSLVALPTRAAGSAVRNGSPVSANVTQPKETTCMRGRCCITDSSAYLYVVLRHSVGAPDSTAESSQGGYTIAWSLLIIVRCGSNDERCGRWSLQTRRVAEQTGRSVAHRAATSLRWTCLHALPMPASM